MKLIELIPVIDKKCQVEIYIHTHDYMLNTSLFEGLKKDIPERFLNLKVEKISACQRIYDGILPYWNLTIQIKIDKNVEE